MVTAHLRREFGAVAAGRVCVSGVLLHALLSTGFVMIWRNAARWGVAGATLEQQARSVEAVLLCIMLPWIAARCAAAERRDDLTLLAALTATPPSMVITARTVAIFTMLSLVAAAGLPALLLAARMSETASIELLRDASALAVLPAVSALVAVSTQILVPGRVRAWLAATLGVSLLHYVSVRVSGAAAVTVLAGILLAVLLGHVRHTNRYLTGALS